MNIDVQAEDVKPLTPRRNVVRRIRHLVLRHIYRDENLWFDNVDVLTSPKPRGVGCEINNTCNAKCTFCGYGKGPDGKAADPRNKGMMDIGVFRHTLKLFSAAGGGNLSLSPILGEATTDKRWLDLVREARSYSNITRVSCYTNAILTHQFGAREILLSGLTSMNISTALGSREQYRRLYGVDKYDQVVRNIFDILNANKELGHPVHVTLMLRIDKPFDDFYDSDLFKDLSLLISRDNISLLEHTWDDFKGLIDTAGLPQGHTFRQQYDDKRTPCYAPYRTLEVLTDGTLQACACRVEPELWVGNIRDYDSLEEAWRSPALEKLRGDWMSGDVPECCKQCSHYLPYTDLIFKFDFRVLAGQVLRKLARVTKLQRD